MMSSEPGAGAAVRGHDHRRCVAEALARAEACCADGGRRLTPIRRRVLELVWDSHKPRGAYSILENLRLDGRRAAPLTVYRALDFLVARGLVHRIESLNAYIGCPHPDDGHAGQFLVCESCGSVAELSDPRVSAAIDVSARALGFAVKRPTVEILGRCAGCREATP